MLTFSYPDRLLDGSPLTDLAAIEVYRVVNPPSILTAPRVNPPAPAGPGTATNCSSSASARR